MNLCRTCGEDFSSLRAFDRHRIGRHEYTFAEGLDRDPPVEDGRRCLDVDELEDAGFVRNTYGRWSLAEHLERGRRMGPGATVSTSGVAPERLRRVKQGELTDRAQLTIADEIVEHDGLSFGEWVLSLPW